MWLHTGVRDLGVFGKHFVASKGEYTVLKKGEPLIAKNINFVLQSLKVYLGAAPVWYS